MTTDQISDSAARNHYLNRLTNPLIGAGMTQEQVSHIRVEVLNKQIILDELARGVNYEQAIIKYKQASAAYYTKEKETPYDPNNGLRPECPELYMMDWRISAMFHLAMGHNIGGYRSVVLEFLRNEGGWTKSLAESQIWKEN